MSARYSYIILLALDLSIVIFGQPRHGYPSLRPVAAIVFLYAGAMLLVDCPRWRSPDALARRGMASFSTAVVTGAVFVMGWALGLSADHHELADLTANSFWFFLGALLVRVYFVGEIKRDEAKRTVNLILWVAELEARVGAMDGESPTVPSIPSRVRLPGDEVFFEQSNDPPSSSQRLDAARPPRGLDHDMARMTPGEANAVNVICSYLAAQESVPDSVALALETLASRAHNRIQTGWDEAAVRKQWPDAFGS